jgi:hypothetical protein
MKNLFGYVMVGLAFTVLQVSTASAQVMSSEQEQMITTNGGAPEKDSSAGQDGKRNEKRNAENNIDKSDAGMHTSANNGEKRDGSYSNADNMDGMKESGKGHTQKKSNVTLDKRQ